ncbi:GNAT family N-acetyltransferase [Actinocatenispora sera]|uniref:GNAT family N-acetyltransferase n=1 Tax=Actinocatenispora sera TaxID=390989 RepID=UPI0033CD9E0C
MRIDEPTPADLGPILAGHDRYWGGRDLRWLHHPMYCRQFADTGLVARADGIVGYLFGFVAPTGEGYVHLVAVRDDARGTGLGRTLYDRFGELAAARGADRLTAITTPGNVGSIAFHRALGFTAETVADYSGPGGDRVVLHRPLDREPVRIEPARVSDAGAVLTVQQAAFVTEALAYGAAIPPVRESVADVTAAIAAGRVLVARDGARVIGAARVSPIDHGTGAEIGRLAVAPDRQGEGLGSRLLAAAEAHAGPVERYVLVTGHRSERNLGLYRRRGYTETHRALDPVGVPVIHLAKPRHTS